MNIILHYGKEIKVEEKLLEFKYKNISQDYELLFELMKTQRVICFVKYRNTSNVFDICATSRVRPINHIDICARGISYISAFDFEEQTMKESFIEQCKQSDLYFLAPEEAMKLQKDKLQLQGMVA